MIDIIKYSTIMVAAGNKVNWKVNNQIEEQIPLTAVILISVASINHQLQHKKHILHSLL